MPQPTCGLQPAASPLQAAGRCVTHPRQPESPRGTRRAQDRGNYSRCARRERAISANSLRFVAHRVICRDLGARGWHCSARGAAPPNFLCDPLAKPAVPSGRLRRSKIQRAAEGHRQRLMERCIRQADCPGACRTLAKAHDVEARLTNGPAFDPRSVRGSPTGRTWWARRSYFRSRRRRWPPSG